MHTTQTHINTHARTPLVINYGNLVNSSFRTFHLVLQFVTKLPRLETIHQHLKSDSPGTLPSYISSLSVNEIKAKSLYLKDLLIKLTHPHHITILAAVAGDFNLPKIRWSDDVYPCDGIHDFMCNCFSSLGFTQFIHEATHIS